MLELFFIAVRTGNYVKMACNAAMTFKVEGTTTTLLTEAKLYQDNKRLVDTYFDNVVICDAGIDAGYLKVSFTDYRLGKETLFIDADSLCVPNKSIVDAVAGIDVDFWLNAWSVTDSGGYVKSHWGNYAKIKKLFNLEGNIANGMQSSAIYIGENTDIIDVAKEVYGVINNNRDVLTTKWMKNFIPDELVWSISTNLMGYDPYVFTNNKLGIGFVERIVRIDKRFYLDNHNLLTFPCGYHTLRSNLKTFYSEITLQHCKSKGIKVFYRYIDKV